MYGHIGASEKYTRPNLFSSDDEFKIKKIEDDGSTVIDDSLTVEKKRDFKAAAGIIHAMIICIPFWLLCAWLALWLI